MEKLNYLDTYSIKKGLRYTSYHKPFPLLLAIKGKTVVP